MLYIVATPIGNLEDITLRALRILGEVDFILCEDTRQTKKLLSHYQINKKLVSFFAHNEKKKIPKIIGFLKEGANIALVSDAGTPLISDPGGHLLRICQQENISYTVVPGPSAVLTALLLSGICADKFLFLGFLPRRKGKKSKVLSQGFLAQVPLVIFESPWRIIQTVKDIYAVCPHAKVVLLKEMTKIYQRVIFLEQKKDIEKQLPSGKIKGEWVIVADGTAKKEDGAISKVKKIKDTR